MADGLPRPDLYEEDFYLWTQAQAEALLAEGRGGRLAVALDWERLAEEVGDMGKRDVKAAKSHCLRVLEHLYKLEADGRKEPHGLWRREVRAYRSDLKLEITPSIQRLLSEVLEDLHAEAADMAADSLRAHEPHAQVPRNRRWTLAQILGEEDDPLG
jgi:hypothetical protein